VDKKRSRRREIGEREGEGGKKRIFSFSFFFCKVSKRRKKKNLSK
jgi:hypothetical protein